ncbi:hypothetical protein ACJ72_05907 [Emergomyces africanus]|uniref:Uncharacterized protein n=1 Tax=Emergomyces africanus TaxID=1955775 RepID=A0A1B7NSS7_9EURO|nr:hypothetical protein ACJ72_05907 [Emergomyces africanus]
MGKGNAKDTGAKGKGKAKAKDNADGKEEGKGKGLKPANSINVRHILKYDGILSLHYMSADQKIWVPPSCFSMGMHSKGSK